MRYIFVFGGIIKCRRGVSCEYNKEHICENWSRDPADEIEISLALHQKYTVQINYRHLNYSIWPLLRLEEEN